MSNRLTITDLERLTGLPRHRLNYAIARRGPAPAERIAGTRTWSVEDLDQILQSVLRTGAAPQSHPRQEVAK